MLLDEANGKKFEQVQSTYKENEEEKAYWLLQLLCRQSKGKLVLLFDNQETLQDPATQELTDDNVIHPKGKDATVPASLWLAAVFGCWGLALPLTVLSLIPRRWAVDTAKIKSSSDNEVEPLSIEGFFSAFRYARLSCAAAT